MPRATLAITLPEWTWVSELSTANPDVTFEVLAAMPSDETGVGLVELSGSNLDTVIAQMDEDERIVSTNLLEVREDAALVQFETTEPLLLLSIREAGVPLELPIAIRDGEAELEVTASRDRLSELGAQFEVFGIPFDLRSVKQTVEMESLLTDDQRGLLETAAEEGYYDSPRRCTLTELAETVGLAKSTTSEKLHRAEGRVIKEYLDSDR
ncbi:helix-turn-helix domain-containing protein [Halopelagius fulvigenes]|uniref:Helix-turn-helix domain-containing protein n=1 Tax=Halopelagius fulvigenes TaxID=1198324 RepID=A0ABD5TYN4_9EURY